MLLKFIYYASVSLEVRVFLALCVVVEEGLCCLALNKVKQPECLLLKSQGN
jgi:hypothetical protein